MNAIAVTVRSSTNAGKYQSIQTKFRSVSMTFQVSYQYEGNQSRIFTGVVPSALLNTAKAKTPSVKAHWTSRWTAVHHPYVLT